MTSIEWTEATWNPVVGCSRVSKGCERCYAERVAHRGMQAAHRGLTVMGRKGPRWNGKVRTLPERLEQPLRWRKPRRVFVNSMSDLFHESVPFEFIAAVFGVMAASPQHTFQILTKRDPRRFFEWLKAEGEGCASLSDDGSPMTVACIIEAQRQDRRFFSEVPPNGLGRVRSEGDRDPWPLPNVWLGVSVENQETADQRIPWLLECPAAVRWVSYEPALGPVDFSRWLDAKRFACPRCGKHPNECEDPDVCAASPGGWALDWVVIGGESGPGARSFDLAWARSTIEQGCAAGVPVFVKQLGAEPRATVVRDGERTDTCDDDWRYILLTKRDRKGGDTSEWPEDLRVREYPRSTS